MPEPLTVAVLVPPAVPVMVTSPVAKFVVASLNTTEKLIGLVVVGSFWVPAWLIVTVGGVVSLVTEPLALPVLVAASVTHTRMVLAPADRLPEAMTVATSDGLVEKLPLATWVPVRQ